MSVSFSLSPFLSLPVLVKLICPVAVPLWPPVCDWCFYWCPTDSGVMRLLQRSQRSIMLPPPTPNMAWQHSSGCFPPKHFHCCSITSQWNKNSLSSKLLLKKTCSQGISHKSSSARHPTSQHRLNLNLFRFIFKHSHDLFAQVPDYMHVSECPALDGPRGKWWGGIAEISCGNWVKQHRQ